MAEIIIPNPRPVVTRAAAMALGLKRYFIEKPCTKGHICERAVSNSGCIVCADIRSKKHRKENIDAHNEARRRNYIQNREVLLQQKAERRAANPEAGREYSRKYAQENRELLRRKAAKRRAENPEAVASAWKKYYDSHKESLAARRRIYMEANIEVIRTKSREAMKAYYRTHKDEWIVHSRNRRARKKSAEGLHTKADIMNIGRLQKWRCTWCKKPCKGSYHVDHITPLAMGGSNWPNNLAISCPTCNLSKNASHPVEFARRLGMLI